MDTQYDLTQRVVRLERAIRLLLLGCFTLGLVAILGLADAGLSTPEVLQAQRFQLVAPGGQVRGELHIKEGGPALVLFDEQGNPRVDLFQNSESTALYLRDATGQPRLGAAHFSHGGSGYALHGPGGRGATALYMNDVGPGRLSFYDTTGTELLRYAPPREP